jgi:16S rRNA (cytidine1402-2'-O)-methyltransferase
MLSTSLIEMDRPPQDITKGALYVVGTPIGNLEDVTLRALRILAGVDLIAAEDTRTIQKLLDAHSIRNQLISYHEHNEEARADELTKQQIQGKAIALASDAGMPTISDPGFRIVQKALSLDLPVIPIPGVSAVLTALSVSGLPTDTFTFAGFPPQKKGPRQTRLQALSGMRGTLVLFESPHRLSRLLRELIDVMGDRPAVLAREMTKRYEEFIRGHMSEILTTLDHRPAIKGECTLLIQGETASKEKRIDLFKEELKAIWEVRNYGASALSKLIARKYQVPKNLVYDEILRLKHQESGRQV